MGYPTGDGTRLESEGAARPCGFDSHPFRWKVPSPQSAVRSQDWGLRTGDSALVDGVCGVKACIRGCEPRGAGFNSRQTHWFSGACSWESKLPPKQLHWVRILALLLEVPVSAEPEAQAREATHPSLALRAPRTAPECRCGSR